MREQRLIVFELNICVELYLLCCRSAGGEMLAVWDPGGCSGIRGADEDGSADLHGVSGVSHHLRRALRHAESRERVTFLCVFLTLHASVNTCVTVTAHGSTGSRTRSRCGRTRSSAGTRRQGGLIHLHQLLSRLIQLHKQQTIHNKKHIIHPASHQSEPV